MEISSNIIYEAIFNLIEQANIMLPEGVYKKIKSSNIDENKKNLILENAKIAYTNKRPLCQDTGQVTIFLEIIPIQTKITIVFCSPLSIITERIIPIAATRVMILSIIINWERKVLLSSWSSSYWEYRNKKPSNSPKCKKPTYVMYNTNVCQ